MIGKQECATAWKKRFSLNPMNLSTHPHSKALVSSIPFISVQRCKMLVVFLGCVVFNWAVSADDSALLIREKSSLVKWFPGTVNRVVLRDVESGSEFSFYQPLSVPSPSSSSPTADKIRENFLALTHARREVLGKSIYQQLKENDGDSAAQSIYAPEAERQLFSDVEALWKRLWDQRFHDYTQQSSRLPIQDVRVDHWVNDQERILWKGFEIQVVATPGYTRGAVSYLVTTPEGARIAVTGDLIQGDGKIPDLYSFQDAIPAAGIRGYHGYASRLADLRESLDKIRAFDPQYILPARGEMVSDPIKSISRLKDRIKSLYLNYISTNALYWYFKAPHIKICVERMLGEEVEYQSMPYSHYEDPPEWILNHATSRILVSDTGHAFLIDCGYDDILRTLKMYQDQKVLLDVEGLFVTHYHDDHTDRVEKARVELGCPVYCLSSYQEILSNPESFRMPALTDRGISDLQPLRDGATLQWREFTLRFYRFPGQTYFHGAVLVLKPGAKPVLFVGDAFTPSGIDDYCLMNRNLMSAGEGYFRCLDILDQLAEEFGEFFMINQHVAQVFEWNAEQRNYIRSQYQKRAALIQELTPWDGVNYAIDDNWVRFSPYSQTVSSATPFVLNVIIWNHSSFDRKFKVSLNLPRGLSLRKVSASEIEIGAETEGKIEAELVWVEDEKNSQLISNQNSVNLVTVDLESEGIKLEGYAEAMVLLEKQ